MGLSGKLAAESNKTVDGTAQLKYQPPPEARVCKNPPWRLYVFKGQEEAAAPFTLNQTPYYLFGKDRKVADIPTDHPSCSRQHAVLCFRCAEAVEAGMYWLFEMPSSFIQVFFQSRSSGRTAFTMIYSWYRW